MPLYDLILTNKEVGKLKNLYLDAKNYFGKNNKYQNCYYRKCNENVKKITLSKIINKEVNASVKSI